MTQDNIPDRIYAWLMQGGERVDGSLGGWHSKMQCDTPYLKATSAREAAPDMLEALQSTIVDCADLLPTLHAEQIRAAIAKAKGENT